MRLPKREAVRFLGMEGWMAEQAVAEGLCLAPYAKFSGGLEITLTRRFSKEPFLFVFPHIMSWHGSGEYPFGQA